MHCQSPRSTPSLPSLHRLSLRAAPTAAPGEYPPNLRDIVELELLLQRLFELKETDENDAVILSDEDQLHRMLFSLQLLYAEVADEPRPPGGPPMTDQDVNALTDIVFELGTAREEADRTGRSFFLTTGAYTRMLEVLEQLAPGTRGAQARTDADQRLQDRLDREEEERRQREEEERRQREEEERRQREEERARKRMRAEAAASSGSRKVLRYGTHRIIDDDDDDEPFKAHPAAVVGWNDFVDAVGEVYFVTLSENSNRSRARAIARDLADAQLREGGLPLARSAEVLATRLIEERLVDFGTDDVAAFNRLKATLLRMAWEAVGSAVRRDLDFPAAVTVLHAAADRGEITPDENSPFDDDDNSESRLIRWLLMGGRGLHRDGHFFIVAQGLAAAATNYAANDAAVKESREGGEEARLLFPHSTAALQLGRELLTRRYLQELQSARRELVARQHTPIRDDGAGPSGLHNAPAAVDSDSDDDLRHADSPRLPEDEDEEEDEEGEEEEPVDRRWNYGGYLRGLTGPRLPRLPRDEEGNVIDEDEGSDYEEDEDAVDQRWIDFYVERSQRAREAERARRP